MRNNQGTQIIVINVIIGEIIKWIMSSVRCSQSSNTTMMTSSKIEWQKLDSKLSITMDKMQNRKTLEHFVVDQTVMVKYSARSRWCMVTTAVAVKESQSQRRSWSNLCKLSKGTSTRHRSQTNLETLVNFTTFPTSSSNSSSSKQVK